LRPHAIFGTTAFPDDDEASQYDLDVHSILAAPEAGLVLFTNHFGTVRGFSRRELLRTSGGRLIAPSCEWSFVADVERTLVVAGRLVASAPRSEGAIGLVVSDLLHTVPDGANIPFKLTATAFGEVTALGAVPSGDDPLIVVGGDGKMALVPVADGRVGPPRWTITTGFRVATIAWHDGALWAAGPDSGGNIDDYDWERLQGGGFALFSPIDGATITSGSLPDDVAWGTGGVAVAPFGPALVAAGRTGCLHLVDPGTAISHRSTAPLAGASLGIAHMTVVSRRVLCGFNRGGYCLHSFAEPADEAADP
jgi:hypothetical protein